MGRMKVLFPYPSSTSKESRTRDKQEVQKGDTWESIDQKLMFSLDSVYAPVMVDCNSFNLQSSDSHHQT